MTTCSKKPVGINIDRNDDHEWSFKDINEFKFIHWVNGTGWLRAFEVTEKCVVCGVERVSTYAHVDIKRK